MSGLPKPPGWTPSSNRQPKVTSAPSESLTTDLEDQEDATSFILRTTLSPVNRLDPNILGFIDKYMMCREARQAAKEIGLHGSAGTAILRKPDVYECISKLTQKMAMKYGYDESEIVERVKEVAGIDPMELLHSNGTYKKMHEIDPATRRGIKKMKVKNSFSTDPNGMKVIDGEILEIEFWDKMKAAELLGAEKKLFKQTAVITHEVGKGMRNILLESQARGSARLEQLKDVTPAQVTYTDDGDDD